MGSPADQFEKIICGSWVHDRDENMVECSKDMGYPDDAIEFMKDTKPKMIVKREGDMFNMHFEMVPGQAQTYKFKVNETVEIKDPNDPPMYHNSELMSLENGVIKAISKSLLEGPLSIDSETHIIRKGNELHSMMSKVGDRKVIGTRVMVPEK